MSPTPGATARLASLAVVADGVGGRAGGEAAARRVVQELVRVVSEGFPDVDADQEDDPEAFSRFLQDAALDCHETLLGMRNGDEAPPASTATLFLGLWPHAYLLQVGDSRCYIFQRGSLHQISRDQTWAQDLIDSGAMSHMSAERSRWAHVLSSAVGGETATPEVTRITRDWGDVVLICSDGLTKHVSDERIEKCIRDMSSARQVVEDLVADALEDGGTDNIAVVVGRTTRP